MGLATIGDSYSGSQSQIHNHSWKGLILWDGHSLSISSGSHLLLLCAKIALRSFVVALTVPRGTFSLTFCFAAKLRTAVVNTWSP